MGLHAIAAAAQARHPLATLAHAAGSSSAVRDAVRAAGMTGWEAELARRAAGAPLDEAVAMLRWWPGALVQSALATARARRSYEGFLREAAAAEEKVAEGLLAGFPFLDALVSDLEWLSVRGEVDGRPQYAHALRAPLPQRPAPTAVALAVVLDRFREDCDFRGFVRVGVTSVPLMLVLRGEDPVAWGWPAPDLPPDASRAELAAAADEEADALAADPWEAMTESRRTRALGVIRAAADAVGGLRRATPN
jgi:hypothetical protein